MSSTILHNSAVRFDGPITGQLFGAILAQRAGLTIRDKHLADAAADPKFSILPVARMIEQSASNDRQRFNPESENDTLRAALSGGTLPTALATLAEAAIVEAFAAYPDSTRGWCWRGSAENFRSHQLWRIAAADSLTAHIRGSAARLGSFRGNPETYRVARYSRQYAISEEDLYDLDKRLGFIASYFRAAGQAPARLVPDCVYAVLSENPVLADGVALFAEARGNLKSGAGSALDATSLAAAVAALGTLTENDSDGNAIHHNYAGAWLVVPQSLKTTALKLVADMGGASASGIRVAADSRLDGGGVDPRTGAAYAGSSKTWYLAADASRASGMGVFFLNGKDRPSVDQFSLDQGQWGIGLGVNYDVGVVPIGRAIVRSTGE